MIPRVEVTLIVQSTVINLDPQMVSCLIQTILVSLDPQIVSYLIQTIVVSLEILDPQLVSYRIHWMVEVNDLQGQLQQVALAQFSQYNNHPLVNHPLSLHQGVNPLL